MPGAAGAAVAVGDGEQPQPWRIGSKRVLRWETKGCQIVAIVVLLVLASKTDSPRHPGFKQTAKTEDTKDPEQYVVFLSLAVVRLFFQMLAGMWIAFRERRRAMAAAADADAEEGGIQLMVQAPVPGTRPPSIAAQSTRNTSTASASVPAAAPTSAGASAPAHHPYRSATSSINRSAATLNPHQVYTTPGAASSATSWVAPASPRSVSPAPDRGEGGSVSPAAHLYAIPDAASTLASLASIMPGSNTGSGTPTLAAPTTPTPTALTTRARTPSLPTLLSPAAAASTHSLPQTGDRPQSSRDTAVAFPAPAAARSTASLALPTSRSTASLAHSNHTRSSSRPSSCPPPPRTFPDTSMTTIPEAGRANPYPEPYVRKSDRRSRRLSAVAKIVDQLAERTKWWLTRGGWVLFVWAQPLLFWGIDQDHSPLKGSPLLWGAVLVVAVPGWMYVAGVAVVVVCFVFLLLFFHIWATICRLMGWENRFHMPIIAGPAQKLSSDNLAKLPVKCYLPHPEEPAPVPSVYGDGQSIRSGAGPTEEAEGTLVSPGEADALRLSCPSVELRSHQSTCAICQSSFVAPRDIPGRVMYEVTQVRELPCKHYFHLECVDKWLLEHSNVCPYCNRNVKDMLEGKDVATATVTEAPQGQQQ